MCGRACGGCQYSICEGKREKGSRTKRGKQRERGVINMCITYIHPHAHTHPLPISGVHTYTIIPSPCVRACVCTWGSSIFLGVTNIDDPPFPLLFSLSLAFSLPSAGICVYTYLLHIVITLSCLLFLSHFRRCKGWQQPAGKLGMFMCMNTCCVCANTSLWYVNRSLLCAS